jgi:hypothetical protein
MNGTESNLKVSAQLPKFRDNPQSRGKSSPVIQQIKD